MKLDAVIKRANTPDVRELAMWKNEDGSHFTISVIVPHYHDIRLLRASFAQVKDDDLTENENDTEKVFARLIKLQIRQSLHSWKNLRDDDGNSVEFSIEGAVKLFTRDDMRGWANRFMVFYRNLSQEVADTDFFNKGFPTAEADKSVKK